MFCTVRQAGVAANNGSWGWNFTKAFFGGLVSSAGWKSVYHSIVDEGGCDNLMSSTFADVFNPLPGDGVGASDACPIGGCDPPLDPDHPRHDPKEPPQKPANNGNVAKSVKDQCLAGYYNSTAGKVIDFGSVLGLVPGWSPNASQNFTEIATLGTLKYGALATTAAAANKWDVVTIQTLDTTTSIASAAGAGLSTGLHFAGKLTSIATFFATGLDILAHAGCSTVGMQQAGTMTPVSPSQIP